MATLFRSSRVQDETRVGSPRLDPRSGFFPRGWTMPLLPVAATLVLWGVIFTLLPRERQEFPLIDDWAYSKGAFAFSRGEGFHYYHQPSMPLLGQWLMAYPVIRLVGESHAALRLLTVALSVVGTLAFYDLLRREVQLSPSEASFAAATLALNPLFFLMSGTFMSDAPAFSLSLLALALYSRALRRSSKNGDGHLDATYRSGDVIREVGHVSRTDEPGPTKGDLEPAPILINPRREPGITELALAAAVATLATVTRQNAVATPLVAAILLWRHRKLRWRAAWHVGVWLPLIAGIAVHFWFTARPDVWPLAPAIPTVRRVFVLCYTAGIYTGLTVLPLLALRPGFVSRNRYLAALVVMLDGLAVCLGLGELFFQPVAYHGGLFPYLPSIITPWGALGDAFYVVGERPLIMGRVVQALLTALACVGGAALADRATARIRAGFVRSPLFLFTVLHALALLVSPTLFDRYLIVLMPGAVALTAGTQSRPRWPLALGVLALFAACSASLAHDWLAWNSSSLGIGSARTARGI